MMIIEEVGALIMWLAVFIGWVVKGKILQKEM